MESEHVCGQYVKPGMMLHSRFEEDTTLQFALSLHNTAAHLFNSTEPMTFPNKIGASLAIRKLNSGSCCMLCDTATEHLFIMEPNNFWL